MLHLTYDWIPTGFDPKGIPWTIWQRAYTVPVVSGANWDGTPSAGTSGSNFLRLSGGVTAPVVGGTLHGHRYAHYNGSSDYLTSNEISAHIFGTSSPSPEATGFIVYRAPAYVTDPGSGNRAGLWCDTSGGTQICISSAGLTVNFNDGSAREIALTHVANAWRCARFKWDGSDLFARTTGGIWHSVACGPVILATDNDRSGANFSATTYYVGDIAEIMYTDIELDDATCDAVVLGYLSNRYKVALL